MSELQYIDIGVNLTHRQFHDDRDAVIAQAQECGVDAMIITGTSVRASESAVALAKRHPGVLYATAGVHPHDAKTCDERTLPALRRLAATPQVVALGECGLDYDRDFSPRPQQRQWFEAQLSLAEELGLPLFLHERAASADFSSMLREHPQLCERAVVHCFTGSASELDAYLQLGCSIGITGWVCDERRGTELRNIVSRIPLPKLMIETDAPFLLPRNLPSRPHTSRNEPAFLPHIAADIARCRGEDVSTMCQAVYANTQAFFALP